MRVDLLPFIFDKAERCLEGQHHLLNVLWGALKRHSEQENDSLSNAAYWLSRWLEKAQAAGSSCSGRRRQQELARMMMLLLLCWPPAALR